MFKSFIRKRKAAQAAKAYKAGYDHAAGEILAAGKNFKGIIVILQWNIDDAIDFGTYNDFDRGVRTACGDFVELSRMLQGQHYG